MGRGEGVILHQMYRFTGGVDSWWRSIHQNKSCYYLGPFQTSRLKPLAEIVFGCKVLTFFVKCSNLDI